MSLSTASFYAAVRATPRLVNREAILNEIKRAVDDRSPSAYVFYITGLGGIGKTFLLQECLRRLREGDWSSERVIAAQAVIDLYHTRTHSIEGLIRVMRRVLRPGLGYFTEYQSEWDRLERFRGDLSRSRDLSWQRERVARAFLDDLSHLTDDYRTVLALDTAEAMFYEIDPIQSLLGLAAGGIAARPWLVQQLLPTIKNSVILIAGRPRSERLRQELQDALGERLIERTLGPLDEEDSLVYFDLVAQAARQSGDPVELEAAARIEAIPPETRRVMHHYAAGRPILLSLLLDYLVIADRLLPALGDSLPEAKSRSQEQLTAIRGQLEADIVRAIQETDRPADEAIRILGWARRGLTAAMLARVAGITVTEAEHMVAGLRHLSFIKLRPGDERMFLQDEMYNLLQRHVLERLPERRAVQVHQAIGAYYEEEIKQARTELTALADQPAVTEHERGKVRRRLQSATIERIHYLLRQDPVAGFWAYYWEAEAAFQSRHEETDMQLRAELLNYLESAPPAKRVLIEDRATWDAGVRWVKRCITGSDYDEALSVATNLCARAAGLMERLGPLAEAELNVWEGWARTYAGVDLKLAEKLLGQAIGLLAQLVPEGEFEEWQKPYLLGTAHNTLGYLWRNQGRYEGAIEQYRHAIPHWQALKNDIELANTRNNLSWALAEVGRFDLAIRACQDALDLRQGVGARYPIALSMNTMAMIQIRADQPHRAERMARQALVIFEELASPRGIGLAGRALAEALRRKSGLPELYLPQEQVEFFQEAASNAHRAVSIFRQDVPERSRLIESLIELGCVYRDWAHLQVEHQPEPERSLADLAEQGERTLRQAAKEAHGHYIHLELDALVNLAWLHFYICQPDQARHVIEREVLGILDEGYLFTTQRGAPQIDAPTTLNWVQIGKAHLLLGLMHKATFTQLYKEHREAGKSSQQALDLTQAHLVKAVRAFTMALAYNELYAPDFRDMRRAKDRIYQELKGLNPHEKVLVRATVEHMEQEYHLVAPSALQRFLDESFSIWNAEERQGTERDAEHSEIRAV